MTDTLKRLYPGPELDRLLAEKVMGWKFVAAEGFHPDGQPIHREWHHEASGRWEWKPPPYSTDTSKAFEIVEAMKPREFALSYQDRIGWGATFFCVPGKDGGSAIRCSTAASAIGRAALKSVAPEFRKDIL